MLSLKRFLQLRLFVNKNISYQEFIEKVQDLHKKLNGQWRLGQVYFNVLSNCRPSIAESIRSTIHDPFHKDEISKELENIVQSKW